MLAGTIGYVDLIGPIAIVGVVVALAYAFALKRRNRKKFDMIGRMIDEGVIEEPGPYVSGRAAASAAALARGGLERRLQLPAQRRALHERAVERGGADRERPRARGLERADALERSRPSRRR